MANTEKKGELFIRKIETQLPRLQIPDPLEGVIEGANRRERYINFHQQVLSKIWEKTNNSGEYGDDFHRPTRYDEGDLNAYTQFGPFNRDPQNLTPEEFELVVSQLGTPDYIRVRSVNPALLNPQTVPITTGGSCILETRDMRTATQMLTGIRDGVCTKEELSDFVRRAVDQAPTITHISGGCIGGQNMSVHYNESDMWQERLVKYGIPEEEARTITLAAYSRINEAIQRRSKLINPNATVLNVNFDELDLGPAISEWMRNVGEEYDPSMRIFEVIYTYVGPNLLDLLKRAMQKRLENNDFSSDKEQAVAEFIVQSVTHAHRVKQIDHGRFKSMNLPKEVITGTREPNAEELAKFAADPIFKIATKLMQYVFQNELNNAATAIYSGFADLPGYGNSIQHESRDAVNFTGRPGEPEFNESIEALFNTPARLHRHNIDAHLQFLRSYINDSEVKNQLIKRRQELLKVVGPVTKRVTQCERTASQISQALAKMDAEEGFQRQIIKLADYIIKQSEDEKSADFLDFVKTFRKQKQGALENIKTKEESDLNPYDIKDLQTLPILIAALSQIESGCMPKVTADLISICEELSQKASTTLNSIVERRNKKLKEAELNSQEMAMAQKDLESIKTEREELEQVEMQLRSFNKRSFFPLSDNPFIHHAMQFLWDPDFVLFMKRAVEIQQAMGQERLRILEQLNSINGELEGKQSTLLQEEERRIRAKYNEELRVLMAKIYPKLETYINYLYGRIDYPEDVRNFRFLK